MIEVHLDALASSINCAGGIVLVLDALNARRRTNVKRGGQKLIEGKGKNDFSRADALVKDNKLPDKLTEEQGLMQSPDGYELDSSEALEDWADRLTATKARIGFGLLVIGFAIDLISKVFSNPLLFAK